MTAYELKQAGFSDDEIQSWQLKKYADLKAAGFGDAEIEAKYGPMGVTQPTPRPYDFNLLGTPITVSHITDALSDYFRPWASVGFSAAESLNRGLATFSAHLDTLSDMVSKYTGTEKGGVFKEAAKIYNDNSDYWKKRAQEVGTGFVPELLGEAVGGAFPGIAEFMLNVPYAAALGAAKADKEGSNVLGGALVEGAKRGVLGALFKAMDPLNQYLRAPMMGTTFGIQTATEGGSKEDIAKAVGTGALYSLMSPGGRYGLNEIKNNALSYLQTDAAKNYEIKKFFGEESQPTQPATETISGPSTPDQPIGEPGMVSPPKILKPFEAKTLISWIKAQGGIFDESLPGETSQFGNKESGVVGLTSRKKGKTFDELNALAKDYGWINPEATAADFIDLLSKDVQAVKQGRERVKSLNQDIEKGVLSEISKDELAIGQHADELVKEGWKVFGTNNKEVVGDINPGDRLLMNGEEFVHVGFDQEGKAILKDGQTFKVDIFDKLPVEAMKEYNGKEPLEDAAKRINKEVSQKYQPELDQIIFPVVQEAGGEYKGNAKSAKSITEKVLRKREGDPSYSPESIKDHARGSIILDTDEKIPEVIQKFGEKGFHFENTIHEPLNIFGYRGINGTIKLSDGYSGEIQIHTKKSWELKLITDEIYRKWRNLTDKEIEGLSPEEKFQYKEDLLRSRKLWSDYWDNIPLEIKSRISESGKGFESVTDPNLIPLGSSQPSLPNTRQTEPLIQNNLPSANLETKGNSMSSPPGKNVSSKTGKVNDENMPFNPDKAFRRTPDEMITDGEPISRADIAKFLEEKLDIPIRTGKFRDRALGIFKPRDEVIRSKYANDIEVIAHEAGHALQKYLWPEFFFKNRSAPFRSYLNELQPLATEPKSGQPRAPEGFAEFIRLYLTNDSKAQAVAPRFYQYFDGLLENKAPEVRNILLNTRAMYDKFMEQPARARVLSQISIGEKESNKWWTFDNLYTKWVDDLHPLEVIVKEMSKKDKLQAGDDPYKLARLLKGVTGKVEAFMKNQPFRFSDYKNIEGVKPLKEVLDSVRDNLDDFRTYIISKRAIELAGRNIETGLDVNDCRSVVQADEGRFGQTFEDLKAYQDATLQYLRDSGLVSGEAYLKMKELNADYDPFYRLIEDQKNYGTGRGLQAVDPIKRIHGGWGDIVDPLESIVKNTFLYISMAERNAVGESLARLAEKEQGLGKFVEKVPSPIKGVELQPKEITKALKPILDKLGLDAKDVPPELLKGLAIFRPGQYGLNDNVITVFRKGDPEFYEVHPEVARVFQGLDKESASAIFKILQYPASWLRAGATLTPEFIGRNPIRDQFAAFVNTKYGIMSPFDFVRGVFNMVKKTDLYWEFKKSGADHSMLVSMDRDYLQDNLGEMLQKYPLVNMVKNPINALRMLSEVGEMATRLGEFERGIKNQGEMTKKSAQEAGFSARELTLDFARAGSLGRTVNQAVAFWNAQFQGTDKMIRQFKDNPVGTSLKIAASITLPSVILAAINSDDPRYKDLPQWQKDLFWIVIPSRISQAQWDGMSMEQRAASSGTIWRIPKPFELGILFGTIPERITNWILTNDPKAFDKFLQTFARGFSPGVIPTGAAPIFESWANKSLFFDRPIVPRSKEDILPQYQYGNYTSETAKGLGKLIGTLPQIGETGAASPAIIENFIRGWSGGLGQYALNIADAGLKASGIVEEKYERPSKTLADIPFFKGFVVRYPSAGSEAIQSFYDAYNKEQKIFKTIDYLTKKEGDMEGAVDLYQKSGGAKMEGIASSLRTIRQLSDMIIKNPTMTGDEKRQQLDILYLQMSQIADYGNKFIDMIKEQRDQQKTDIIPIQPGPQGGPPSAARPTFNFVSPEIRPGGGQAPVFQ